MTYAQYGTISATDFNGYVGGNPTTTANTLNATWATGGGSAGYGQTALANVAAGNTVAATGQWATLVSNTASAASHQGSSITTVTAPVAGGTITYLSAIPTNLQTIYTNKLNAATQGSTAANSANRVTTWNNNLVATFTATFANGDAARYFFNSGGQLKLTFSHPTGTTIDNSLNALATACGTVVISAPSTGSITVASTSYNGVTKIGGSGTVNAISTNSGYYGLGIANTTIFKQLVASAPVGYTNTNINIIAKTNGTQGSNSDNGTIVTIYCNWAELTSTGLTASAGSNSILTVAYPETTYLTSNSWGAVTTTASVTGA
jgi:hypothetical protein